MKNSEPKRTRLLLMILGGALLVFALLMPWVRRMNAETARIERETAAKVQAAQRQQGDSAAIESAKRAVEGSPSDPNLRLNLVQLCSEAGFLDEARRQAEIAVGLAPNQVVPLLALADVQQRLRKLKEVWQTYRAILQIDPKEPRATAGLGYLYVSLGWTLDALDLLKPAVREMPDVAPLKVTLAMAYQQKEQYVEAEALMKEVRSKNPDQPALWSPLVQIYLDMKDFQKALPLCLEILGKQPDNQAILLSLGEAYYGLNDYTNALKTFQTVLEKDADNVGVRKKLGFCYQNLGRNEEAMRALERALQGSPNDEAAARVLARLYRQAGRSSDADSLMAKSKERIQKGQEHGRIGYLVANKPRDPEAHYQMAEVYAKGQDNPRAIIEAQKALELKPDHTKAKALMTRLQP